MHPFRVGTTSALVNNVGKYTIAASVRPLTVVNTPDGTKSVPKAKIFFVMNIYAWFITSRRWRYTVH